MFTNKKYLIAEVSKPKDWFGYKIVFGTSRYSNKHSFELRIDTDQLCCEEVSWDTTATEEELVNNQLVDIEYNLPIEKIPIYVQGMFNLDEKKGNYVVVKLKTTPAHPKEGYVDSDDSDSEDDDGDYYWMVANVHRGPYAHKVEIRKDGQLLYSTWL